MLERRLLAAALIAAAAACSSSSDPQQDDPCDSIICEQGQDCVDGKCVDREPPTSDCTSNLECTAVPGRPYCSLRTGICVQCTQDVHCPEGSTCVSDLCDDGKCDRDEDCPARAPLCRPDGQCVVCLDDDGCEEGEVCSAGDCRDAVIACDGDADCAVADPGRPVCLQEPGGGRCVECAVRGDCGSGRDCVEHACVDFACGAGGDCSAFADRPHCLAGELCVECLVETHCGGDDLCEDGACVPRPPCEGDDDCAGNPVGELCDTGTGKCVLCLGDADCAVGEACTAGGTLCTPTACTDGSGCPAGFVCTDQKCARGPACQGDDDCTFDPRAARCSDDELCVECLDGGDCERGESCDQGVCRDAQECTEDASCSGGYVCEGQDCVACRTDDDCPRGSCQDGFCGDRTSCTSDAACATGVCARGVCVECASDLDCRPGLWCNAGTCGEGPTCLSDAGCGPDRTCQEGACRAVRCVDDAREPDGTLALARPAPATGPVFGRVCPNDDDWMVFAANTGVGFESQLTTSPPDTELALFWFDATTGALQRRDPLAGKLRVRALPAAKQDRYYLRVRSTGSGSYVVVNTVTPAGLGCADVLEPNDTRQAPSAITPGAFLTGLTACGDQDWLSITTTPGLPVRAYVFSKSPMGLGIFDGKGANVADDVSRAVPYLGGGRLVEATGVKGELLGSYLLRVDSTANPAEYSVYVAVGDDVACDGAVPLLAGGEDRARVAGTTLGRRTEAPAGACGAGGPDMLYEVTLGGEARLAATVGAGHDARLSLLRPGCGVELSCAPFAQGRGSIDVPRVVPGSYVLAVGGSANDAGPFDLAVRTLPVVSAPPNDRCAGSTQIDVSGGGASVAGQTTGASADLAPSCSVPVPDVFYAFTLLAPQRVIVDVAADAPVYAALVDAAQCATESACGAPGTSVHLDVNLPAGDHALAIGSATGVSTSFQIDMVVPAPVNNETCAGAAALSVPSTVSGDATWARDDLNFGDDVTCTSYFTYGHDTFYRFSGIAGQRTTFTLTPEAGFDGALYVVGDCGAPQCLAGVDAGLAGAKETLVFQAPNNGTYRVVVDGAEGGGTYQLSAASN